MSIYDVCACLAAEGTARVKALRGNILSQYEAWRESLCGIGRGHEEHLGHARPRVSASWGTGAGKVSSDVKVKRRIPSASWKIGFGETRAAARCSHIRPKQR